MALRCGVVAVVCLLIATPAFGLNSLYDRCFGAVTTYASASILRTVPYPFVSVKIPTKEAEVLGSDWREGFLRFPNEDAGNPGFLKNHTEALRVFDRWFRGISQRSYIEMLSRQHYVACLGPTGDTPYIAERDGGSYSTTDAFPGLMRHLPEIPARAAYQIDSTDNSDSLVNTLNSAGWATDDESFEKIGNSYRWRNSIDRIPKEFLPENIWYHQGTMSHYSPSAANHAPYLARMAELAEALRETRWSRIDRNPQGLKRFVYLLADYYHTSINWMPFISVNNSILMSHVNYTLRYHGFHVLPHEFLDFLAFFSSTSQFRLIFWNAFIAANPIDQMPRLPLPHERTLLWHR